MPSRRSLLLTPLAFPLFIVSAVNQDGTLNGPNNPCAARNNYHAVRYRSRPDLSSGCERQDIGGTTTTCSDLGRAALDRRDSGRNTIRRRRARRDRGTSANNRAGPHYPPTRTGKCCASHWPSQQSTGVDFCWINHPSQRAKPGFCSGSSRSAYRCAWHRRRSSARQDDVLCRSDENPSGRVALVHR